MADARQQARRIREIRRALAVFAALFVLWWIVEFITYAGRAGALDAYDFAFVPILAIGGWLLFQAWRARCPRCGNPFFVNDGLPLGFHFTSQCPYCGLSLKELPDLAAR